MKKKDMQDHTPASVRCSKCGKVILTADMAQAYRERDIQDLVKRHSCSVQINVKSD